MTVILHLFSLVYVNTWLLTVNVLNVSCRTQKCVVTYILHPGKKVIYVCLHFLNFKHDLEYLSHYTKCMYLYLTSTVVFVCVYTYGFYSRGKGVYVYVA